MNLGDQEDGWLAAQHLILGLPRDAVIVLACHANPDGDAIGSMLGFALGLRQLGYTRLFASFPAPLEIPECLSWLPGLELLVPETQLLDSPTWGDRPVDLLVAFDAGSESRLGRLSQLLATATHTLVVDHHASNTRYGQINLVEDDAPAAAVVADRLLSLLRVELDRDIATCLYVAVATDTGSFRFSNTPEAHQLAARLVRVGIDVREISRRLFDVRPFEAVRLFGTALSRAVLEPWAAAGLGLVWTYVLLEDLADHGLKREVLDPLIDQIRCAEEAEVACLLKQVEPGEWSVSLRSRGSVPVNDVAVALGGGGHRAAAGFNGFGEIHEIIEVVRQQLSVIMGEAS